VLNNTYDSWKTIEPEDTTLANEPPCPVCTGDEDAQPCGEDCDRIVRRVRLERGIQGLYNAAFSALFMAKVYRREGGNSDRRMVKAVYAAQAYRASIKCLRSDLSNLKGVAA
jgi:hypothetical protein